MRAPVVIAAICIATTGLAAQEPTYKNSIGMEFVLIKAGKMQVGVFHPVCPDPNQQNAGRGGFGQGRGGPGDTANAPQPGSQNGGARPTPQSASQPSTQPTDRNPAGRGQGRGGPRPPADPRTQWTPEDYAKCAQLVKQDWSDGFSVDIAKSYYIGKFEVTQSEWKQVMGANPSVFQGGKVTDDADRHPVDSVSWEDTQSFVKKLNALEKTKAYRLPTEFEWEYAGRAGGSGQVSWTEIRKEAWEQLGGQGSSASTHVVGTKQPNAWGLYDMLGNVWEWVQDPYNGKLFADPVPQKKGPEHVLKGGGIVSDVKNVIYATHAAGPGDGFDVGFRIVRAVN